MGPDAETPNSGSMSSNRSIAFFDEQFRRQAREAELELNPFEVLALPCLRGEVLDLGCGMGNLAIAAARTGCKVTALDASPAAIEHVRARAAAERLPVEASLADLRRYAISREYDCVVCIGLLMFFDCPAGSRALAELQAHVRPGGFAVVNVLVEGTTYLDMFDPSSHCLFTPEEVRSRFAGWEIVQARADDFPAPGQTVKCFFTLIARRPRATGTATA